MIAYPLFVRKLATFAVLVIEKGETKVWGEFRDSIQDRTKPACEELENLAMHDKILYESLQIVS